jgi:transposase
MPSLVAKTVHGKKYWQLVESRRVNGQPRSFVLMHLGRPADLLKRLQRLEEGFRTRSVSYGAVTALWSVAEEFGVVDLINAQIPRDARGRLPRNDGVAPGVSLLLAGIGRACEPTSKRAWAQWACTTSLPRLAAVDAARMTSQHFWDQMNLLPVQGIARIEEALVRRVVEREGIAPDLLFYDTTNFFTFIASDNERCTLAQRGHSKQKRHDLRQLGLGLVVSRDGQLPLFHLLYEGSRPDARVFPELLTSIRERVEKLFAVEAVLTMVYDKGNNSRSNQAEVDRSPLRYVASLVPSTYPALLAEANGHMEQIELASGEIVRADRIRRELWGAERTLIVLDSATLRAGQIRGLHQQLHKRLRALAELTSGLEAPRGGRGRRDVLHKRIDEVLRGQHIKDLLHVEIVERSPQRLRLQAWVDAEHYHHLCEQLFGKRILMTDHHDWSTADIITAYRGQSRAERAFRELKDPGQLAVRPTFHWTDQKLKVHTFCCVLGYLLVKLLERRARRGGVCIRSVRSLLRKLRQIRETTLVQASPEGGRPKVRRQLDEVPLAVARLAQVLGLPQPPAASI